ncbi:MAG: SLC13 family permease, partial [Phycisphaerales bacterium]|nr:SLC13 family permease [Phycisphaerales bacterium]
MGIDAWITLITILLMFAGLMSGRVGADIVVVAAMAALLVTGVLTPADALRGFASPPLATVAVLYVVAAALKETGALALATRALLGTPKTALAAQARLVLPVGVLSGVVNNTPIVAMFLPVIDGLSRRTGIPASRLLLPLSYAAILGGVCTLIGTSTNLVVDGMIKAHNAARPDDIIPEFGMFTITPIGVPVAIAGLAYILLLGRRLLPDRSANEPEAHAPRRYTAALRVLPTSPVVGKTLEAAGLRHLPGLFLSRIERASETIIAVGPEEVLHAGDVLVFVGVVESVADLQQIKGLEPAGDDPQGDSDDSTRRRSGNRLIEAVIGRDSPILGMTVREAGIRTRYGAVVVGVHRQGQRKKGKIGDVILRPGDTLLMEAAPGFARRHRNSSDFTLVSEVEGAAAPRHEKSWIALAILIAMVALAGTGVLDMFVAALLAGGALIATRCLTGQTARKSLDWTVLVVIGGALGIGGAMEKTGLAASIAHAVLGAVDPLSALLGPWVLLAVAYLLTLAFTATISNNAAAALMFPILLELASARGLDFRPFAVCLAVAASCEFFTPIGYQTNLMVMGP